MRTNDVGSILLSKGFWRIDMELSDEHPGRRLAGGVRAIVKDGPTISTDQLKDFEKHFQKSLPSKTLYPFKARHSAFICTLLAGPDNSNPSIRSTIGLMVSTVG